MDLNYAKYSRLFKHISHLRMRDVRMLFSEMRQVENCEANVLFPQYGFTIGEFATAHTYNGAKARQGEKKDS